MKPETPAQAPEGQQARMPAFCPRSLLMLLWDRARPSLTRQELRWLVDNASEFSSLHAAQLEGVLGGIACLVANDESDGSFQSAHDVPDLLFMQSNSLSMLGGIAYVANGSVEMLRMADGLLRDSSIA